MPNFTQVFGGQTVYPSDLTYVSMTLSTSTQLYWSTEKNPNVTVTADIMDITATGPGLALKMPDATQSGNGQAVWFNNLGTYAFTVQDFAGNTIVSVAAGTVYIVYMASNATQAGVWRAYQLGATTTSANASALAGLGLVAIGATLAQSMPINTQSSNYTVGVNDRSSVILWTAGTGTLTLTAPGTLGSNWFVNVKNAGSGVLTLTPASGTIDSSASVTLNPNASCIVITDGANFYTIGTSGGSGSSSFTYLSVDVSGSGDFTLSPAQQGKSVYKLTGTLTGARNFIVPSSLAQYDIDNSTTGAFTLTVKTASGTGVAVSQAARMIVYCDGTNVLQADTGGISVPISVANGGTGAITPSAALTNLGGTSTGTAVFTASTQAAGRSALGSTTTGDALFIAASAAAARTTLGSGAIGDAVFTAATVSAAVSALYGTAVTFSSNTETHVTGSGATTSAIIVQDATHATSRRAAVEIGSYWRLGQDNAASGTRDFFLYNINQPQLVFSVNPTTSVLDFKVAPTINGVAVGTGGGSVSSITFSAPLTGGTISTSGTVGLGAGGVTNTYLANMANQTLKGNFSGSAAAPSDVTVSTVLDAISSTRGAHLYRGSSGWAGLAPSATSGVFLQSNGSGADPGWSSYVPANVATTISAGTMLTGGGDLSTARTISMANLSGNGVLVGSPSTGSAPQSITLGSNLTISGSTLSVTGVPTLSGANTWTAQNTHSTASVQIVCNSTTDGNGQIIFQSGGTQRGYFVSSSTYALLVYNTNNTQYNYQDQAGNFVASANISAYSDARLKEDVTTIHGALKIIEKLRGVRYRRKDSGVQRVGMIAQETQSVLPEVVMESPEADPNLGHTVLSISYGDVVGVLVEAVKELTARVRVLEAR
jgi:Chaperone of endosialidase/Repeat of unknown function (DUF5907)